MATDLAAEEETEGAAAEAEGAAAEAEAEGAAAEAEATETTKKAVMKNVRKLKRIVSMPCGDGRARNLICTAVRLLTSISVWICG